MADVTGTDADLTGCDDATRSRTSRRGAAQGARTRGGWGLAARVASGAEGAGRGRHLAAGRAVHARTLAAGLQAVVATAALGEGEHHADRAEAADRAAERRHVAVGEAHGVAVQPELLEQPTQKSSNRQTSHVVAATRRGMR